MSKENVDIKYELIPYDGFIGSKEFDFDKAIYDLNSQIELLSSQADNLDYVVAIASGIACGLLDILWVGEFDLTNGRSIASDKVDAFVKKTAEMFEGEKFDDVKSAVKALEKRFRWWTATSSERFCSPSNNCRFGILFINAVYGKIIWNRC